MAHPYHDLGRNPNPSLPLLPMPSHRSSNLNASRGAANFYTVTHTQITNFSSTGGSSVSQRQVFNETRMMKRSSAETSSHLLGAKDWSSTSRRTFPDAVPSSSSGMPPRHASYGYDSRYSPISSSSSVETRKQPKNKRREKRHQRRRRSSSSSFSSSLSDSEDSSNSSGTGTENSESESDTGNAGFNEQVHYILTIFEQDGQGHRAAFNKREISDNVESLFDEIDAYHKISSGIAKADHPTNTAKSQQQPDAYKFDVDRYISSEYHICSDMKDIPLPSTFRLFNFRNYLDESQWTSWDKESEVEIVREGRNDPEIITLDEF